MHSETSQASEKWYVVQCKPRREADAANGLRDYLGLTTYVPEVIKRVRGKERRVPFFPGYLFLQADLQEVQRSTINSAPGVLRLLESGSRPQPVPSATVRSLRERLEELNAHGGLRYSFNPGDPVVLTGGPFKGLEAAFLGPTTGKSRVKVLLYFLGRLSEAQVDMDELEPTSGARTQTQARPLHQGRTTRGKGRRISY